jgi:two-component system, chemotaxis family, protein-glutamate methylesterase/glutaminase
MTHDIIAIGGSAGSQTGLKNVVRQLPPSLSAAVFVVIHLMPRAASVLPDMLFSAVHIPKFRLARLTALS